MFPKHPSGPQWPRSSQQPSANPWQAPVTPTVNPYIQAPSHGVHYTGGPSGSAPVRSSVGPRAPRRAAPPFQQPQTFFGKPHFVRQRGDVRHGSVVLLPQSHGVSHAQAAGMNQALEEQILTSQFEVFASLQDCHAQHVFIEGFTPDHAAAFNGTAANAASTPRFRDRLDTAFGIAAKFNNASRGADLTWSPANGALSQVLTQKERELLTMAGGAGIYCLISQYSQHPVQAHPTHTAQEDAYVQQMTQSLYQNYQGGYMQVDPQQQNFVLQQREAFAARSIASTELGGQPAFLVYGRGHAFAEAFNKPDSPALFRKMRSPS